MKVRFAPRARSDLESILEYLSEHNLQGAHNVKQALQATISLIGHFPESGRFAGEEGVRVLPAGRYPYLVLSKPAKR
jgi:plasmid stabilization system protein ParE